MKNNYSEVIRKKAETWLSEEFDEDTRNEVRDMMDNNEEKLIDAFYQHLEFGTGGLRGIMGAGTNRMNKYTLGMTTQGLSNYLIKQFASKQQIKVAIGYDCRNNSRLFSEITAGIFAANGFEVYLFESLRPTPELSFAIRHLGCQSGVIITASHNPPEYNGYKAYWDDGGQVTSPHDHNIIEEVRKIKSVSQIKFDGPKEMIHSIGKEIDDIFINAASKLSLNPESISLKHDMGIVYTPIHGSGVKIVPAALHKFGFTNIINVPEQDITDGNFPTVKSPNPEEAAALELALKKAEEMNADLVMATDPDADRQGIAIRNRSGKFILLNGNQTAAILTWYILDQMKKKARLKGNEYIIKTIVTSQLLDKIAEYKGVECFNVLTGFKYFASLMKKLENTRKYIGGGEESFGYLASDYVRDKDAVGSCALIAEIAAWAACRKKSLIDILIDIYCEHGLYKERLFNIVRKGKEGADEIRKIMSDFRTNPPKSINNSEVIRINDYQSLISKDLLSGNKSHLDFESSNVLQFFLKDGTKVSVRPSGTEPKIKFYFSVNDVLEKPEDFEQKEAKMENRIDAVIKDILKVIK